MIRLTPHPSRRGHHLLETEQWLPRPLNEVFNFFADAFNLETITPPILKFRVLTPAPILMQAGQLIDYRLRLRGIPIRWRSEIAAWEPPYRFIDRQVIGPYRLWHHEHTFEEREQGTFVRDRVEYSVPGGEIIHRLFVRNDVRAIFEFRFRRLNELLG